MALVDRLLQHRARRQLELKELAIERRIELFLVEMKIVYRMILARNQKPPDLEFRRHLELDFRISEIRRFGLSANRCIGAILSRLEVLKVFVKVQTAEQERQR